MIVWYFIAYLALINYVSFSILRHEKRMVKNFGKGKIKDHVFIGMAILGASYGIVLGVWTLRYKRSRRKFRYLIPLISLVQLPVILYIITYITKPI